MEKNYEDSHEMSHIIDFTKKALLAENKLIKGFLQNFKGCYDVDEDFHKLLSEIDLYRIAIPVQVQDKIDYFITMNLEPLVFEPDVMFAESREIGEIIDGVQHMDTKEEAIRMLARFYMVLFEAERHWNEFAMEELHPLMML